MAEETTRQLAALDARLRRLLQERLETVLLHQRWQERETAEPPPFAPPDADHGPDTPFWSEFNYLLQRSGRRMRSQRPQLGAFQGEHGAYSEAALRGRRPEMLPIPCRDFPAVFSAVLNGRVEVGVIPVENSLEGAVTEVNDLLVGQPVQVCGEIRLPVRHCLLALPGTRFADIRAAYSHPQALAQCRRFFYDHAVEPRPFYDTAGAARWLSETRPPGAAVVAGPLCRDLYGLEIVVEGIADDPDNTTRFLLIRASGEAPPEEADKCSIVFSTRDEAGALLQVLSLFSAAGVNLTRIESRPLRGDPGSCAFLLDFLAAPAAPRVREVLAELERSVARFRVLGWYKGEMR